MNENHKEYEKALRIAKAQGIVNNLYRIEDKWGGYWQCVTSYGVFNFKVSS